MTIDVEALAALRVRDMPFVYDERDTMLYALSIGLGADPLDAHELPFVYEGAGLRVVPTMAVVLASTGIIRKTGVNFAKVLHGEQRLTLHRPLVSQGKLLADSRVIDVFDKGAAKGAILLLETAVRSAADNAPLFTYVMTIVARGDGGLGGSQDAPPQPHTIPERAPDHSVHYVTRPDAALLYRLNADRNPLHADPQVAARAGFPRPILHGLATYGIACRAVLKAACNYEAERIQTFDARFSGPVYPGDEVVTEVWKDGNEIAFRARVPSREIVVLDNGRCKLKTVPS